MVNWLWNTDESSDFIITGRVNLTYGQLILNSHGDVPQDTSYLFP